MQVLERVRSADVVVACIPPGPCVRALEVRRAALVVCVFTCVRCCTSIAAKSNLNVVSQCIRTLILLLPCVFLSDLDHYAKCTQARITFLLGLVKRTQKRKPSTRAVLWTQFCTNFDFPWGVEQSGPGSSHEERSPLHRRLVRQIGYASPLARSQWNPEGGRKGESNKTHSHIETQALHTHANTLTHRHAPAP